jgi:hypothetical protein
MPEVPLELIIEKSLEFNTKICIFVSEKNNIKLITVNKITDFVAKDNIYSVWISNQQKYNNKEYCVLSFNKKSDKQKKEYYVLHTEKTQSIVDSITN